MVEMGRNVKVANLTFQKLLRIIEAPITAKKVRTSFQIYLEVHF